MPAAGKFAPKVDGNATNAGSFRELIKHPAFLSVALALSTFVVFLPIAWNDFVNYDDPDYVTANAHVRSAVSWSNIAWALKTSHASNWHPLTWLSHMIDWQVFRDHAGAHHLVSLGFHIGNTVLLFLLLRKLTGALWRSAIVAGLFALHPMHVESVAWVSERKDVLSGMFWMLTIFSYSAYVERRSHARIKGIQSGASKIPSTFPSKVPASCFYVLSLVLFALGLMSKPMLVTLPFVLLLLDYWPLGRWSMNDGSSDKPSTNPQTENARASLPSKVVMLLLEKVPFFVLSFLSSYVTFLAQQKGGAVSTSISWIARLENALVSYARYLGKMVWPHKLSVLYPHPGDWPAIQVIGSALLLVLISGAVLLLWRRRPYLPIGWFWFVGTLVPVIGLVQVGVQSMADRYTYIPSIGFFIVLVWGTADILNVQEELKRVPGTWFKAGVLATFLSLLACASLTFKQVQYWRNSEALFSHAVEVTKGNYLAYNNLGFYLSHQGKILDAMENYRKSLEINPGYEDALNNMGYALAGQKKPREALPYYQAALRVRPNHVEVHNNLGNALADLGEIDQAMEQYEIVLRQQPNHVDAHNNLGIALAMKGRLDEGINHFKQAIRQKPNDAGAHSNLGNALAAQQKFKEATQEYQESLRLKPDDAQANNNLGNVLAQQGLLDEAIVRYQRAIQLNADNPEAHFNLGMALARQGRRAEAVIHLKEAMRLRPDYQEAKQQVERMTKSE